MKLSHALGIGLVLTACGAPPVDPPEGTVHQMHEDVTISGGPRLVVLAVDDAPTAEAAALRARIVDSVLPATIEHVTTSDDSWRHVDLHVAVVHPSIDGPAWLVTPADHPDLALVTEDASDEQIARLEAAVAREIGVVAAEGSVARPIERLHSAATLLSRHRAPADEREAHAVAAIPEHLGALDVALLTVTDDAGEGAFPPAVPHRPEEPYWDFEITRPCGFDPARTPRLEAWAATHEAWTSSWTCSGSPSQPDLLFSPESHDYTCLGTSAPIALDDTGAEACTVLIAAEGVSRCDPARGWIDPADEHGVRRPRWDERGLHVCEILPVSPRAREGCRSTRACSGCGGASGYCVLDPSARCPNLHFVGGALPLGRLAHLSITCDLVTPSR